MRIPPAVFFVAILLSPSLVNAVQASASTAAPSQSTPGATAAPPAPSILLQPALDTVRQTLTGLGLEKWKRGTVRDEAAENIGDILRDLQENMPQLMKEADAAPGSISKVLPVSQHVNALYDVLLRVVDGARISAPGVQVAQLQQALLSLGNARHTLEGSLQQTAVAQEKQLGDLRNTVAAQANFKCPAPPPAPKCVAPAPRRKVVKKKPAAKSQQTAPSSTTGAPKKTGP